MRIALPLVVLGLALGCRDCSAVPPINVERDVTLTTSSDEKIAEPTDEQIRAALAALNVGRDGVGWAILGRSEMTYVQVSGDETQGFAMEYQDGDVKHHYRAARENFSLEQVGQALAQYRDGTINWSAYGNWVRIEW